MNQGDTVIVLHLGLWQNATYIQSEGVCKHRVKIGKDYVTVAIVHKPSRSVREDYRERKKTILEDRRGYGRAS